MKAGSAILTPKQNDRVWNGIILHFQRRWPELCPQLEKVMGTILCDVKGYTLVDLLPRKGTVDAPETVTHTL
jgi:hypothetical protein